MRIFYKILASIFLFFSVSVTFFVGGAFTIEGINVFSPFVDTEFAPRYSPEKFGLIRPGQSIKEVEAIIGPPLSKSIDSANRRAEYSYTNDGKLYVNKKDGDFAWYRSTVYFKADKVIEIDKGWSYD